MNSPLDLINWSALFPEFLVLSCLLILCCFEIIFQKSSKLLILVTSCSFLIGSLVFLAIDWVKFVSEKTSIFCFFNSFQVDSLTISFRFFIVLSALLSLLFSFDYIQYSTKLIIEYTILILTASLGGMLLSGANNLVLVFVGLETLSLSSYLLTAYTKLDNRSNEAALKYFTLGAVSSTILLYGFSLIYGLSNGALQLDKIQQNLLLNGEQDIFLKIPLILLLIGIGFKLSAAPFHQWAPDVYEGAPTPVITFLSVGSKAGVICSAIRIFNMIFISQIQDWQNLFEILAVLSLIIGNFSALSQQNFKRLLAYSSIGQIGFLLIGFVIGNKTGYVSLIFYLFVYLLTNSGVLACVILYSLKTGKDTIKDYSALINSNPIFVFCLSVGLLSLAGLPPFSGFFSKLYIFLIGWQSGHYLLVVIALLTSLISVFYYLKIIKIMILPSITSSPKVELFSFSNFSTFGIGIIFCTLGSLFLGFFGQTFISFAEQTVLGTSYII